MHRNHILSGLAFMFLLSLAGCSGNDDGQPAGTSMFNPNLPGAQNTGEPGGDTTAIAGLWDGTTEVDGASDVVYWNLAANGVLTRYDYQQDGAPTASGENCYVVGEPITVTPEGGADYSIFDVAVTAVRNGDSLTITFIEADKNDLDSDDDTTELPTFVWTLLATPVLDDLNSCTLGTSMSDDPQADGNAASIPAPDGTVGGDQSPFPAGIDWSDISQYTGTDKPYVTRAECTSNNGSVIADIGDGTMFQPEYRCESGLVPIAYITYLIDEPISVEGEVCCV